MKKIIVIILLFGFVIIGLTGCVKKITLKEGEDIAEITQNLIMTIKEGTLTNKGATVIIKNNTNYDYNYGPEYIIEKSKDGKWYEVETEDPLVWNSIAYVLKANESKEYNYNWSIGYGELSSGKYRLIKKVFKEKDTPIEESDKETISVEFEIK